MIKQISHTHRALYALICIIAFQLIACGICGFVLPPTTTRPVTVSDVAGNYTYTIDGRTVLVCLNTDSTVQFENSARYPENGTWSIEAGEIGFQFEDGSNYSGWWWIADAEDGGYDIIGGESIDPDDWWYLEPSNEEC